MLASTVRAVKPPGRDEAALITRILEGETALFQELILPYHRLVYVTAYAIVCNKEDAEDISQEAILKSFRYLASFRGEAKFSTWLTQITANEARMRLRRDKRAKFDSLDGDDDNDDFCPIQLRDWREIPSEALENSELREELAKALTSLPAKYREILVVRDVQQLNIEETAVALGISVAQVKTRLHRARMRMRDLLAPKLLLKTKRSLFKKGLNPWR